MLVQQNLTRITGDLIAAKLAPMSDASFLEIKIEGTPRRLDGRMHRVAIYLRDYRNVGGIQIPHLIETTVQGVERTEKIVIEKAAVNPHVDDRGANVPAAQVDAEVQLVALHDRARVRS